MTTFYLIQKGSLISVRIKTEKEINAISGSLNFEGTISPVKVLSGNSDINIWQTQPQIINGEIHFVGGIPGGSSRDIELFSFSAKGEGNISFGQDTKAYLNDGAGTEAKVETSSLQLILTGTEEFKDTNPPLEFEPKIINDPAFEGRVVFFETQDLESGISKYEIKEYTPQGEIDWHTAQSPYLINSGVKKIEIKAIDNFGNERVEKINTTVPGMKSLVYILVIFLVAICVIILKTRAKYKN